MSSLNSELVTAIQSRLADLGYYRLRIDGVPGPGTSNAIIRFKEVNGLRARDYVGPVTMAKLYSGDVRPYMPPVPVTGEPPWLTEARGLLGTREVPGSASNPAIMQWAHDLDQWYTGDDVPWCGLFVAHCMSVGAPNVPQNFNRLGARNWLEYGVKADMSKLPLGGVAVFWRTHKTQSWNGHVALITGQNDTHLRCIGGNQNDAVTEAWFSRERLLGVRMPTDLSFGPAPQAKTGILSTNEA